MDQFRQCILWFYRCFLGLLLVALALGPRAWAPMPPVHAQVGPPNQIQCNQFANFTGGGSLATVTAGVAGKIIVICGWHVTSTSATTTTFQLSSGTGTNCATTNTNLTPALNVTLSAPSADHIDFASLSLATGNNLCVNAPSSVTGGVWLAQF